MSSPQFGPRLEGRRTEDVHNLGDRKRLQRTQEGQRWPLGDALGRLLLCVEDHSNFNEQTTLTGWSEYGTLLSCRQGDEALERVPKAFWTDLNHLSLGFRRPTFDDDPYLSLFIDKGVWKKKKSGTVEVKPQQRVSNIFTFIIKLYIYTIDP